MKLPTELGACKEACDWLETQPDLETAWQVCQRGDWMLWLAGRVATDRKPVVLAACKVARQALKYTTDERVQACILVTEGWCRGETSIEDVQVARRAAVASASASASAYAYAADAAAAASLHTQSLAASADIVRSMLSCPVVL